MTPLQSQFNVTLAALESANDEVHELRAENTRLHELFRIDGEQHSAYVKTILHDQDTRLAAYKAEIERLLAALQGMVYETTFHRCKISKVVLAVARRALEHKP